MHKELLKAQIQRADQKTQALLQALPDAQWQTTPDVLHTNVNWQIGHIVLASYWDGVASISGSNVDFERRMPLADYIAFYGQQAKPSEYFDRKPSASVLREMYTDTLQQVYERIDTLTEEALGEATAVPNPVAKTKYDALVWFGHHQSQHNGQLALLKRVLNTQSK